jgi:YidC/Oxa1 family membrane protein insertase
MILCLAVLFGWVKLQSVLYPPQELPPPATGPSEAPQPSAGEAATPTEGPSSRQTQPPDSRPAASQGDARQQGASISSATEFTAVNAPAVQRATLGDDRENNPRTGFTNPYEFAVDVTSRGAGIEAVRLSRYRENVVKDKNDPDHDPYILFQPIKDPATGSEYVSLVTEWVRLIRENKARKKETIPISLDNVVWTLEQAEDAKGQTAILRTTVKQEDLDALVICKTYRVEKGSPHVVMSIDVDNLSRDPLEVVLGERGPVGMKRDDLRSDYRRVVVAAIDDESKIDVGGTKTRHDVFQGGEDRVLSISPGERHLLWADLANKYFACILAPGPQPDDANKTAYPKSLIDLSAKTLFNDKEATDDLTFVQQFSSLRPLARGEKWSLHVDAYCGAKSNKIFSALPQAVARNYPVASIPDHAGCTFEVLSRAMLWLLTASYRVVHNYGVAIIILVIIVRLILHPITRYGQVNMMKAQKGMAKLKPKIDAIQQQYKNDRQKLNDETMKLYREEGVNPASTILSCLPMMLQMPVWVALWTTLNTNVDMRHEPFFAWMNDLASPDALFTLPERWHFRIPLIGSDSFMGPVLAFNLLPIIMTVTMYFQQKFTQKLTKPATPPPVQRDKDGRIIPDQMAQQQKMMSYMMLFFGLLFYNFPSGLNLYILSSNLFGMGEQYLIKKRIREQEEKGEFTVKKAPRQAAGPSFFERIQKRIDQARAGQSGRGDARDRRRRR